MGHEDIDETIEIWVMAWASCTKLFIYCYACPRVPFGLRSFVLPVFGLSFGCLFVGRAGTVKPL